VNINIKYSIAFLSLPKNLNLVGVGIELESISRVSAVLYTHVCINSPGADAPNRRAVCVDLAYKYLCIHIGMHLH